MIFVVILAIALLQGAKSFYYDSDGYYRVLAQTFVANGHFSLLNFHDPLRGYALPLIYREMQALTESLAWKPSSLVKLFNALLFALIGMALVPRLAERAWPRHSWGLLRRLSLVALLLVFWSGYLNFPLSDFPALTMALLAIVAIAHQDRPGWMLLAGGAGGLALNMRPSYLPLEPMLVVLILWAWLDQRGGSHPSLSRRATCVGLLVLGFVAVSLPQSLSSYRHGLTWSPVPGASVSTGSEFLTPGLVNQRYDTYVGPDRAPEMFYRDPSGIKLLETEPNNLISGTSQYMMLIMRHPIAMTGVFARHIINGLDSRYSTVYIEHLESRSRWALRVVGFLFVFLALVRVAWPTARRRLGPGRARYPIAFLMCVVTTVPTAIEPRYLLPVYLLSYVMVLTPGWPSPIESGKVGWRRFRTVAILLIAYVGFMAIVWNVTSIAGAHLQFG